MSVHSEWNDKFNPAIQRQATAGLRNAAEFILAKALEIVPIEEGTLAKSGTTAAEGTTAAVSFNTPYAARQHEELDWSHDAGRTAKYLERPMTESKTAVLGILAAEIGKALK